MRKINRLIRPILAMLITGGVMTNSPSITGAESTKPAAVQTVKDGLSVSIGSERDVYAADQTPAFDVNVTNTRDSAIRLSPGLSMFDMWTITIQETSSGVTYRAHSTAEYRRRIKEITTLGAKESKSIHLDFSKFQFINAHQLQGQALTRLPAGKYRLTISMKFEPIFDIPEVKKPDAWAGEIKTDAVLFEVAAK